MVLEHPNEFWLGPHVYFNKLKYLQPQDYYKGFLTTKVLENIPQN